MTQNKKIIAITGGIGSGKSTVCSIISEMGYKVFSCDEIYSELLMDKNFLKKIEMRLGNLTDNEGNLDRKKLAEKIFSDSAARKTLNEVTHPEIMSLLIKRAKESEGNIAFCEVPLLFENGFEKLFDDVIVVMRDKESRVKAVVERSNLSAAEVEARIMVQFDYSSRFVNKYKKVNNNGNIVDLKCTMRDIVNNI